MVEGGPQRVLEEVRPLNLGVEVVEEDLIQEEVEGVEVLLRAGVGEEEEEEESQQHVGEEEGEAQWLPPVEEEVGEEAGEEAEEQKFHRAVEEVEVVVTEPQDQWAEVQVQPHSGLVRQEQAPGHILPL